MRTENKELFYKISSQPLEQPEFCKSLDRIDRKVSNKQGRVVISGKHFHEEVTYDECEIFEDKFVEKLKTLAESSCWKNVKVDFNCKQIGGTAFLATFDGVRTD